MRRGNWRDGLELGTGEGLLDIAISSSVIQLGLFSSTYFRLLPKHGIGIITPPGRKVAPIVDAET
jgi:hypothetical protein